MARLADLATRRPLELLGCALAALALLTAAAAGAPDRLGAGASRLEPGEPPDLVIVARGSVGTDSRVSRIALSTILSGLQSDPEVASARAARVGRGVARIAVELAGGDDAPREQAATRIEGEIDPGPLELTFSGPAAVAAEARDSLSGQFWKLELLALPFVALVLVGFCGGAGAIGAALTAAGSVVLTLSGMRFASLFGGVSLVGASAGAVVGLVLAVEMAALVRGIHREERLLASPADALARALSDGAGVVVPLAVLAALAPLALLVTPFPATGSVVLGTCLGALGAVLFGAAVVPALLAIHARLWPEGAAHGETRVGEAGRGLLGRIAGSRAALAITLVVALIVPLALAAPARDVSTRALGAADLPGHLQAAAQPASDALVVDLPLAAAIVAGGLALALVGLTRSIRPLVAVPFALLPAAAALGALSFVVAQGHLAGPLGLERQGSLDTGAVACALAALAAVGAGRCARDALAVRAESRLGAGAGGTAELAAGIVLPAAAAASLAAGGTTAVLAGADLYPAREFGLVVAFGLLVDLALRPVVVALLSRLAAQ